MEEEKPDKEKLRKEIEELKSKIKNTEYDLMHMFKGNSLIEQKLFISKQTLEEKEKMLKSIEEDNSENKEKKIKDIEEEIIGEEIISKEQKETIEENFEEEIIR